MADQQIRFCTAPDGVRIAHAIVGEGPPLVKTANWLSHLEFDWRSPIWRHWLDKLSQHHTLVRYDERGCGLSDWEVEDFTLEAWVRDLESVVDDLGLEHFPLLGISQGGAVAITYAVRHPERVSQLILYGTYAKGTEKRMLTPEQIEENRAVLTLTKMGWGRDSPSYRQIFTSSFVPGANSEQMRWFNDLQRESTSPENAVRFLKEFWRIDVSHLLNQLTIPTLVLHARGDLRCPFEEGRRVAAGIRGARFVPLDGDNHILLEDEPAWTEFLSEVRTFLGVTQAPSPHTASLRSLLFTDVEGSTTLTQKLGDSRSREVLREQERIVREALNSHGGSEVKTMGDGFMASFSSATRALECAIAIQRAFAEWNASVGAQSLAPLRVRIGLNAGEPIAEQADLFGTAVNMAARICSHAEAGQILASVVIRELAAGKGFLFADRGEVALRGFEDPVRLYELRWREEA